MSWRRFMLVIALAAGTAVAAERPDAHLGAQGRQIGGVGITVFESDDFDGRNATFRNDVPDLREYGLNDRITSLRVAPGEMWEGCVDANYGGRCQVFSDEERDLRRVGWNDMLSLLRRVRGGGGGRPPVYPAGGYGVVLYSSQGYRGDSRTITDSVADLRTIGFNDQATSLRVLQGAWEVCVDIYFHNCRRVDTEWPNLASLGLSRRISSIRPASSGPDYGQGARIIVHEHANYRGRRFTFGTATAQLPAGISAQSVQIEGGVWEVCAQRSYEPPCVRVSQDVANLTDLGLSGIRSVRPIGGIQPR